MEFRLYILKNGGPVLLEHLTFLLQILFMQGLVLPIFCVGKSFSYSKKSNKNLQSMLIFQVHNSFNQFMQAL